MDVNNSLLLLSIDIAECRCAALPESSEKRTLLPFVYISIMINIVIIDQRQYRVMEKAL